VAIWKRSSEILWNYIVRINNTLGKPSENVNSHHTVTYSPTYFPGTSIGIGVYRMLNDLRKQLGVSPLFGINRSYLFQLTLPVLLLARSKRTTDVLFASHE
jgi:hypothetical protein